MTEEAKQTALLIFQQLLRHGEPAQEVQQFQLIHDRLLADLQQEPASDLKTRLLAIPTQLAALIAETRAKYERVQHIIAYIEATNAADLTQENILHVR